MLAELNKPDDWSGFMSRMLLEFEDLLNSRPTCIDDIVRELRKHDDSVTFLEPIRAVVSGKAKMELFLGIMQHNGYYASIEEPWLVCSKSKKQHDTMLFAAQAAQVLAEANMMVVPGIANQYAESSFAA